MPQTKTSKSTQMTPAQLLAAAAKAAAAQNSPKNFSIRFVQAVKTHVRNNYVFNVQDYLPGDTYKKFQENVWELAEDLAWTRLTSGRGVPANIEMIGWLDSFSSDDAAVTAVLKAASRIKS